jgi:phosphonate transport system substrate-binding protein
LETVLSCAVLKGHVLVRLARCVASGEVDAASVDSLIYDYMRLRGARAIAETKILERSEPLGIPPFVVSPHLENDLWQSLQKVLLEMNGNPEGLRILKSLGLDGFYLPPPGLYDGVRRIVQNMESP